MMELREKINAEACVQSFIVSKMADYFMLRFPDDSIFGQANELVSAGLSSLQDLASVEIRAFSRTKNIQDVLEKAKRPGEAVLNFDVNVYGPVDQAVVVGDLLSASKLFLQDPEHDLENVQYMNPHIIQFPGLEEPSLHAEMDREPIKTQGTSKAAHSDHGAIDDIRATIYSSLKRFRSLPRAQCGGLVLTPLLPYV